jgi:hypothetical protein
VRWFGKTQSIAGEPDFSNPDRVNQRPVLLTENQAGFRKVQYVTSQSEISTFATIVVAQTFCGRRSAHTKEPRGRIRGLSAFGWRKIPESL